MFYDEKILYQKQYHSAERLEQEIEKEQQLRPRDDFMTERQDARAFFRKLEKECICKLRPDRSARKHIFINLSKKLSEDYEIDIKITQRVYFIKASFHMDYTVYFKDAIQTLTKLMEMCDRICTFAISGDTEHFRLDLDYFTHDCWVGGKKIWA